MVKKIYFIENSIQFNSLDLNTTKIAGSEKTLINISNELGKNNQFYLEKKYAALFLIFCL